METCTPYVPGNVAMQHEVNCICAKIICSECCHNDDDAENCEFCEQRNHTFFGPDALNEFCRWLFNDRCFPTTAIAHNAQVGCEI